MPAPGKRLILLDRDGVINCESPTYVKSVAEWRPIPGSLAAIARLTRQGYEVIVVTNQSGVGRGLLSEQTLQAINAHMSAEIEAAGGALAGIYWCPHLPEAGCDCRKPKPGLLRRIERDFGVSLAGVPMIGDKLADLQAAAAVAARPILVLSGNGAEARRQLEDLPDLAARTDVHADLASAVNSLLDERATI